MLRRFGEITGRVFLIWWQSGTAPCSAMPMSTLPDAAGLSVHRGGFDLCRRGSPGPGHRAELLAALIGECEARGFRQMIAVIGDSRQAASITLHRTAGFTFCGTLHSVGYKFGRWIDSVNMQRALGPGDTTGIS